MDSASRGQTVRVHYTGTLRDGSVFDSSQNGEPLEFTLGSGEVIPGFDEAVLGMSVGDEKTVEIPVDQAYGPHRSELLLPLERNQLPDEMTPEVGQSLQMSDGRQTFPVTIREVGSDTVVLDANHPLAGKDLVFVLTLLEIVG
jgi:peptidylprolyl isomerase